MFTGIVQAIGRIERSQPLGERGAFGRRVSIDAPGLKLDEVAIGDSIAINGACMTAVAKTATSFEVDVSNESLSKTAGFEGLGAVNLEKSLRLGDRIDGHLVSGHVDGVGEVQSLNAVGESFELVVRAPRELAKYLAIKGSIAVHGVSLTVNRVEDHAAGCDVWINLIPHTLEVTTLKHLAPGARVNLEIDTIARYVERMLAVTRSASAL